MTDTADCLLPGESLTGLLAEGRDVDDGGFGRFLSLAL